MHMDTKEVSMEDDELPTGLRSCPFCRKDQTFIRPVFYFPLLSEHLWLVECLHCGVKGPLCRTIKQAKSAWNAELE